MLSQFRQVFKPIEDTQIFVIYLKAFFGGNKRKRNEKSCFDVSQSESLWDKALLQIFRRLVLSCWNICLIDWPIRSKI